jgi:hypothetical protein
LTRAGVAAYLQRRFAGCDWADTLAGLIHQRTDGNPLLMINVIDLLLSRKVIVHSAGGWQLGIPAREAAFEIPENIQQMVERQIARSAPEEQALLKAAAIVGTEFSAGALAAALGAEVDPIRVEEHCHNLAHSGQWLAERESGDDQFCFIHELYQRALRRTVPAGERIKLHLRIAGFLETTRTAAIGANALELARHWEEGRVYERAIPYLLEASRLSARRHAARESLAHLHRASALLEKAPAEMRGALEATILEQRGLTLRSMDDVLGAASEFERLEAFARDNGNRDLEVRALLRLSAVLFWFDHERCLDTGRRAVQLSRQTGDPGLMAQATGYLSSRVLRLKGWSDLDFENCGLAADAARRSGDRELLGLHLMSLANFCSHRTQYDEASQAADEGMRLAALAGDPYHYISCQYFKAWALLHAGHWGETLVLVRNGFRSSRSNEHQTAAIFCRVLEAWLHLEAFDCENAGELADWALSETTSGLARILALIIAARAYTALDSLEKAESFLHEVCRQRHSMDWAYNFPFLQATAELCLAKTDWAGARAASRELSELARRSRQETYLGIAGYLRMEAALGDGGADIGGTGFETGKSSLADWRLHSVASRLAESYGHAETAGRHRTQAAAHLELLAESMPYDEPLAASVRRKISALLSRR